MSIINETPLHCTLCHKSICNKTMMDDMPKNNDGLVEDPKFYAWWIKNFCTFNDSVDPFILYLPYFLLIAPLIILSIERLFMTIFKSGLKLDAFYNLLVNEALLEGSGTEELVNKEISTKYRDSNNSKLALEVAQTFWHSSSYFYSYLFRFATSNCFQSFSHFQVTTHFFNWLEDDLVMVKNFQLVYNLPF